MSSKSLFITGACCRLYAGEGCTGRTAVTFNDVPTFHNWFGDDINDKVVSYTCLLSTSQTMNYYCVNGGVSRLEVGENVAESAAVV